jgi:hypothetical protein
MDSELFFRFPREKPSTRERERERETERERSA